MNKSGNPTAIQKNAKGQKQVTFHERKKETTPKFPTSKM